MEYKTYNFHSFNLYTIKTDKFKNCHLEVVFRNQVDKDEIIPRKFLIELLTFNTKEFNSQKDFSIHLEELYNTSFYSLISRVGNCLFTNFCLDFLNPKYCEKGYLDEVLNIPIDAILNPNIEDEEFDKDSFNVIKKNIINEIDTASENVKSSAYRRLFELMDENSPLSINMLGDKKSAEKITGKDVMKYYKKMLKDDYCDIYIIGDLDMDYVANYFETNFKYRIVNDYDLSLFYKTNLRKKIQVKKEEKDINQGNLLVGCNIDKLNENNRDVIAHIYNFILGSGSLDTKLGTYLRQDNSLCYTVNSIYQKYDGVIVIYAGIDASNYDKALKLIKKSLKEMVNNISNEELENAKLSLITSLNMIFDNPSSIINNYLFKNIADLKDVKTRIKEVEEVTIEDIYKFAKNVKINTVYMVSGVE